MPVIEVEAPAWTARPFGLFSVLDFESAGGDYPRWTQGVRFAADTCSPIAVYATEPCEDVALDIKALEECRYGASLGGSFTVQGIAVGTPGADSKRVRATADLLRKEQAAAEFAMWNGISPYAYDDLAGTPISTGLTDVREAVALLESFAASRFGGLGVIHANPYHGSLLSKDLVRQGQTLITPAGTPVVIGGGYLDGVEDAEGDNNNALYITPQMVGFRTEVVVYETFSADVNDQIVIAQREYLIAYDDCGVGKVEMASGPSGLTPDFIFSGA